VTRALTLTFTTFLLAAAAALAQAPPAGAPAPAAPAAAAPAPPAPAATAPQKPDAAVPQGFTYNPEGRRDPFVSMLRRGDTADSGPRVSGLAGLGTAEVSLRGTVRKDGSYVGILKGVDTRNYIVRAGDKLADGTIQAISADALVILQQVNDPLSLEKQREVRKLLRQTEEGK